MLEKGNFLRRTWAAQDLKSHQGYWSTWLGYNKGRKCKNHGRS